jgi:ChpA-C
MLRRHLPSPAMVVALVALVLAAGGFASAQVGSGIPGPDGMLHACYATFGGALRAVAAGEACQSGERSLAIEAPGDALKGDAPLAFAARTSGSARLRTRLTPIASSVLPAGTYNVSGAVRIKHPDGVSQDARVTCLLQGPDRKVIAASRVTATFLRGDSAGEVTLPISTTIDRMPVGRLSLACSEAALGGKGRARVSRAPGSPGTASGNVVQVPVHVPINVCGNTVEVIDLLNPAFGNTCVSG